MSIDAKHAYRFGYLKSDKWKAVRLEALVREKGKCQICGEESVFNDAHHKWYPENIQDTTEKHLVILCRPCHDFIHAFMPECKTGNEEEGCDNWRKFHNAITVWRISKAELFKAESICTVTTRKLGIAYDKLREENQELKSQLSQKIDVQDDPNHLSKQVALVMGTIKEWSKAYIKALSRVKTDIDNGNDKE